MTPPCFFLFTTHCNSFKFQFYFHFKGITYEVATCLPRFCERFAPETYTGPGPAQPHGPGPEPFEGQQGLSGGLTPHGRTEK